MELHFLAWEIEAGKVTAAMQRLRTGAWPADLWPIVIAQFGFYIAAGDAQQIGEVRRLAKLSGAEFETCILKMVASWGEARTRSLSKAAQIRKSACDGQGKIALDMALEQNTPRSRIGALAIVAEGLAGIPGIAEEWLPF